MAKYNTIKLPKVGDEHTMTITECLKVAGEYGEQVRFDNGTDAIYLPIGSADSQLKRLFGDSFAYTDAVGNTLRFHRTPNNKRAGAAPYWNIDVATPNVSAPSKRLETPAEAKAVSPSMTASFQPRREAIVSQYLILWDTIANHLATTSQKYGYGLDAAAIQAATATIWISWKDKGIQPDGLPEAKSEAAPQVKMPAPSGKRIQPPIDLSDFPPEPDDSDLPF